MIAWLKGIGRQVLRAFGLKAKPMPFEWGKSVLPVVDRAPARSPSDGGWPVRLDRRWLILPLVVLVGFCVHRLEGTPSGAVTRFTPDADSLAVFAECMRWEAATSKRIAAVPHYVRHDPPADTLAATNGSHVWVWDGVARYPALRHEWVHLALWPEGGDPMHRSPHWFRAATCGAITHRY